MKEITEEDIVPEIEEEKIEINPVIKELAESNKVVLVGNKVSPGCGSVLGLKIALQVCGTDVVLVGSYGCVSLLNAHLRVPAIYSTNAIALAAGVAKSDRKVLVYSGDGSLETHKDSLFAAAKRNENILCICYNNQGNCNMHGSPKQRFIAKSLLPHNVYIATASLSHIDDYIRKLRKASAAQGFRFIELLCPCPTFWGFDSSNTIEVARLAVESGFWPLYESENGTVAINVAGKPQIEKFLEAQLRYKNLPEEKILKMKETAEKNLIELKNVSK